MDSATNIPRAGKPAYRRQPVEAPPPSADPRLKNLRRLFWLYIALWLIEGALRKWIVPSLANPLLVVRDPILVLIYALALTHRKFPRHSFVWFFLGLGSLCLLITVLATSTPWLVALYGFRTSFWHVPLIFLLPNILDESDVRNIGRWILICSIPMGALVMAQFVSSRTSWLNTGAGGGEGGQLESAFGHVRPSGTFSFTNGLAGFTALTIAFFLYHLLRGRVYPRVIWAASGAALLLLVTLSGSRQAAGVAALMVATVLLICVIKPAYLPASIKLLAVCGVIVFMLGAFAVFREGINVFRYRFGNEQEVRSGFVMRFFGSMVVNPEVWQRARLEGMGLGRGTSVAGQLLSGTRDFLLGEGEYDRMVLELGPLLGVVYILSRQALTFYLAWRAYRSLRLDGSVLPLLILSACGGEVFQGQFSQPTALGFVTIAGGLCLSATHLRRAPLESGAAELGDGGAGAAETPLTRTRRGRSIFAEQMLNSRSKPGNGAGAGQ